MHHYDSNQSNLKTHLEKRLANQKANCSDVPKLHLTGNMSWRVSTINSSGIVAPTIVTCVSFDISPGGGGFSCRI